MNQENASRTLPEPLAKRRRGRPRKDENHPPKEKPPSNYMKNIVIHESEIKPIDDIHENANNINLLDEMVGQQVSGVIEGSFDAGFLLAVKIPTMETVFRGVVFRPGRICSVTPVNDIAPLTKMHTRKDLSDKNNNKDNSEIPINFASCPVNTEGENKNNFTDFSPNQIQNQNQFQDHVLQNPVFPIGNSFITMLTTTDGSSFPAANPPFVLNNNQEQQTLFSPHLQQNRVEEVGEEIVGSDHRRQVIDGDGTQDQESNGC